MKKSYFIIAAAFLLTIGISKAQITNVFYFNGTNGEYPVNSFIASGGVLYGMINDGGAKGDGGIFSIDTSGNNYKDLLDFNGTNGSFPKGKLILSGSLLYGMTYSGGKNSKGCIFSINTNGTGYSDIWDFDDTGSNGATPMGNLTLSGSTLYGMTVAGGRSQDGNVFSININGTGYTDLLDFDNTNGQYPYGSLTLSGSVLYGMAYEGGANNWGCIFSVNTNGSGYKDIYDFDITHGKYPYGSLTLSGSVLYGTASQGGVNGDGLIFSINIDGSNFKDMLDFDVTNGNGPQGALTLVGNVLYGLAPDGGSGSGVLFYINTNGSGFNAISFGGSNGRFPYGDLTVIGNKFYGMSENGGSTFEGNIFGFKDNSLGISKLALASDAIAIYPNPSNGLFTLQVKSEEVIGNNSVIEVYNILGEKVFAETLRSTQGNNSINLSGQPNGVYLYKVVNEDGTLAGGGKLVIQK